MPHNSCSSTKVCGQKNLAFSHFRMKSCIFGVFLSNRAKMKELALGNAFFGILVKNQYHRLRLQPTRSDFDWFWRISCFLALDFRPAARPHFKRKSVYAGGPPPGGPAEVCTASASGARAGGEAPGRPVYTDLQKCVRPPGPWRLPPETDPRHSPMTTP